MRSIPAKTIVSGRSGGGWFGSDYSMNIYKGCCHGCIYCDSRSSCYNVDNFDEVRIKENALEIIKRDLQSKRWTGTVITGSMSDAYNPFERKLNLTRGALELIDYFGFGVCIDTKSDLVCRDIDILSKIKTHSPAIINFTVTTADDGLCLKIERNVCPTSARLAAIKNLSDSGISCGILLMPILPFINDTEDNIIKIVDMAANAGAKWIYTGISDGLGFGVTLRQNQRSYFFERLDELFPSLKDKYIKTYGENYICTSQSSKILWEVFKSECDKFGLYYHMGDIIKFIKKEYEKEQPKQLSIFD